MNKYKGVIHVHSIFSDGSGDIQTITKAAKRAGIKWLIITDHNNTDIEEGIINGVCAIKGEEISPEKQNHYLALGIEKPITGNKSPGISRFHVPCDDRRAYIFRCECDHSAVLVNQFHNMFVSLVYQQALPSGTGFQEQHVFLTVETHIAAVPDLQTSHQIFKFVRIHMRYSLM